MKKWVLKAIVQKIISGLPGSHKINYLFQKYVTRGVQLSDDYFHDKLLHAADHLQYFHKYGKTARDFRVLELGTGWYPVVPLAMYLCGTAKIVSIDINPLMNEKGVRQTIKRFLAAHEKGELALIKSYIIEQRLHSLQQALAAPDFPSLLHRLHFHAEICDARQTPYADEEFDLICSNNVYEHIYPDILRDIIREFQRILKRDGVNSHFIDMSDHFAHLDSQITIYNFLRFSQRQWRWIDNDVQPQNRLRYPDYARMYAEEGIELWQVIARKGDVEALQQTALHPDYADYLDEELAISHVHLVNGKSPRATPFNQAAGETVVRLLWLYDLCKKIE